MELSEGLKRLQKVFNGVSASRYGVEQKWQQ